MLSFYPPQARAAGIEGSATLQCDRDAHLALTHCVVTSETPSGHGFGAAALAMAAQSQPNPSVDVRPDDIGSPDPITVVFSLNPPSVGPDLREMTHLVSNPAYLSMPSPEEVSARYPKAALGADVSGHVTLDCEVTADGMLASCAVTSETPTGLGFGDAARALVTMYRMEPMMRDGQPVPNVHINVPVTFETDPPPHRLPSR